MDFALKDTTMNCVAAAAYWCSNAIVRRLWRGECRWLKDHLCCKLILPCGISRGNGAECGITDIPIGRLVVHLVEGVERLSAEVEARGIVPQPEGFMKAKVCLEESIGYDHIALGI